MEILYESDNICCSLKNDIVLFTIKQDCYDKNDVEPVKIEMNKLFKYENNKPYLFSFIFDLTGLSYSTLYSYSRTFSNFFLSNRDNWKIHQQVAVCITNKTFLKAIVTPFVKLANTGKPFSFQPNLESSLEFIEEKLANYNFELNYNDFKQNSNDETSSINLDEMLTSYEK